MDTFGTVLVLSLVHFSLVFKGPVPYVKRHWSRIVFTPQGRPTSLQLEEKDAQVSGNQGRDTRPVEVPYAGDRTLYEIRTQTYRFSRGHLADSLHDSTTVGFRLTRREMGRDSAETRCGREGEGRDGCVRPRVSPSPYVDVTYVEGRVRWTRGED